MRHTENVVKKFFFLANAFWLFTPLQSHGATIVSNNAAAVASFVGTSMLIGFDNITGCVLNGTNCTNGRAVAAAWKVTNQYAGQGVEFSSGNNPAFVVSYAPDARSDPNLLGGTSVNQAGTLVINYRSPIDARFASGGVDLVGAWNDPTGSVVKLEAFDTGGALLASISANQGYFLGISTPGIARATFSTEQTSRGFTIDNFYFHPQAVSVPLPPALGLFGTSLAALLLARRRKSTANSE
jgi:hypothetical protein